MNLQLCTMASVESKSVLMSSYKSFTEVYRLSAKELKHNVSNTLPKSDMIFKCHILGLSTVGSSKQPGGLLSHTTDKLPSEDVARLRKMCREINYIELAVFMPDFPGRFLR